MKKISFLDTGYPNAPAGRARFHVIPAPMETTVSYGGGTAWISSKYSKIK